MKKTKHILAMQFVPWGIILAMPLVVVLQIQYGMQCWTNTGDHSGYIMQLFYPKEYFFRIVLMVIPVLLGFCLTLQRIQPFDMIKWPFLIRLCSWGCVKWYMFHSAVLSSFVLLLCVHLPTLLLLYFLTQRGFRFFELIICCVDFGCKQFCYQMLFSFLHKRGILYTYIAGLLVFITLVVMLTPAGKYLSYASFLLK